MYHFEKDDQIYDWFDLTYHTTEVKANGCEVKGQHSVEIKLTSQAINISAKCLLSIAICNLCFKKRYLIHSNISSLAYLDIFMMCYIAPS